MGATGRVHLAPRARAGQRLAGKRKEVGAPPSCLVGPEVHVAPSIGWSPAGSALERKEITAPAVALPTRRYILPPRPGRPSAGSGSTVLRWRRSKLCLHLPSIKARCLCRPLPSSPQRPLLPAAAPSAWTQGTSVPPLHGPRTTSFLPPRPTSLHTTRDFSSLYSTPISRNKSRLVSSYKKGKTYFSKNSPFANF